MAEWKAGIPSTLGSGERPDTDFAPRACWLSSDLVPASVTGANLFDRLQNPEAGIRIVLRGELTPSASTRGAAQ
jgi:hypothetical protein